LATCTELPNLDNDDRPLVDALNALHIAAEPTVWDDPGVDWTAYDLVVIRSTWDYTARRDEFLRWAESVPRLANPAAVVAWNTDKRYLAELGAAGAPVVPTTWLGPTEAWEPPPDGETVVKPAVGVGSVDCGRYDLADPAHRRLAGAHVRRLQAAGRAVLVQPYLPAVDHHGETALLWLGGHYSHAIRKGALLHGPDEGVVGLHREEDITPREPTAAERETARRVLANLPFDPADLLYARVDLLPGDNGPVLLELELTEPSLFLATAAHAAHRLAAAIRERISRRAR
jgi:glutathione synthase/RimK-type ligase-like ATP-grasp enzyme